MAGTRGCLSVHLPLAISGYVLAGGRSSRMGREKALLELAGKPLIQHGLTKLRRICREVAILSNSEDLKTFSPIVKDLHPDCGPMSGIEAALANSSHEWSLIVPVDVPFLPTSFLAGFARMALGWSTRYGTRVALYTVDGVPQPTLLMIHRDLQPYLTEALAQGRYKVYPELKAAADDLQRKRQMAEAQQSSTMMQFAWTNESRFSAGAEFPAGPEWSQSTPLQEAATHLFFANLNTTEDLREAEKHIDILDT